jgi:predicted transcriptional regulator
MVIKNRDMSDIVAQILYTAAQDKSITKTKITIEASLSFKQLKRNLFLLIEQGLLVDHSNENPHLYQITEKDTRFLKIYEEVAEYLSPMQKEEDLISVCRPFSMWA